MINLFSLHYFLWFSALTSIYGFINVYAEHYAHVSSTQYGLLNMVMPFVSILAKIFFCSLADRHRAYRLVFACFLFAALIGYGSFGILPFFIKAPLEGEPLVLSVWITICIMVSVSTIAMSVVGSLSDAFAMNSAKKRNSSYGYIRLWGTLGWGFSSLVLTFINETKKLPFLVPGLLMTIFLIMLDLIITLAWPYKDDFELDRSASDIDIEDVVSVLGKTENSTVKKLGPIEMNSNLKGQDYGSLNSQNNTDITSSTTEVQLVLPKKLSNLQMQWMLFKEVAMRRVSIFRYMIMFTISGALISLQWSYLFLYLKDVYPADFLFASSLSMIGQSMLGELPFFILSNIIIKYCGRSYTLSISIISIGVRYLMYQYLLPNTDMYFVLVAESLAGPSFGLFYVVMTEVGLEYSDCEEVIVKMVNNNIVINNPEEIEKLRQGLRATMQSLMSACYEGLGVGIGSAIGGLVIDNFGFSTLWLFASLIAIFLGVVNLIIEVFQFPILADRPSVPIFRPNQVS